MTDNQLIPVLSNLLEEKSANLNNNQVFSLISLMLLQELIDIFKLKTTDNSLNLPLNNQEQNQDNQPSLNNLVGRHFI